MPAAIPAIAAAASAAAGGVTIGALSVGASALAIGAASFAFNTLASKLAPKPKTPSFDFSVQSSGRTQQIRQAITSWKALYGEVRVSGPFAYIGSTNNNKYLHMVIVLACHEVEAIDEIYLNDVSIPPDALNSNGAVISGPYKNYVRIKKHLGSEGQAADPDLVSEVSEWTSDHKLSGRAYLYVRMQFNKDVFPTAIPNVSAVVRGKKVYDSRTGETLWTPNVALMGHDYLTDRIYGVSADAANVNALSVEGAANACEEIVTTQNLDTAVSSVVTATDLIALSGDRLRYQRGDRVVIVTTGTAPGGLSTGTDYYAIPYQYKGSPRLKLAASLDDAIAGTAIDITDTGSGNHTIRKTGEPRYFGGGQIDTADTLGENLQSILSGMGGKLVYIGGQWSMYAAVYRAPAVNFDESHLRGALNVTTKISRRERFNTVKGVYVSPVNDWQPSDYPALSNSVYRSNDNEEELIADLDLPFTQRAHTAQRLAKIKLEQHRQEIVAEAPFSLHALQVQPTDTCTLNNDVMGWSDKIFEIDRWRLTVNDNGDAPVIETHMVLEETASAVYDWNAGEETVVDPAPNTNLPNPFDVDPPIGLSIDSIKIETLDADNIFRVKLSWEEHGDEYVLQGGQYEIQYKKSGDIVWTPTGITPDGGDTCADVFSGELGTTYDIRIRTKNYLGVASPWQPLTDFTMGTAGGVTSTDNWQRVTDSVSSSENWGLVTDSISTSEDWGGLTA